MWQKVTEFISQLSEDERFLRLNTYFEDVEMSELYHITGYYPNEVADWTLQKYIFKHSESNHSDLKMSIKLYTMNCCENIAKPEDKLLMRLFIQKYFDTAIKDAYNQKYISNRKY